MSATGHTTDIAAGLLMQVDGNNGFKEPNILSNHFHGLYGNPGTENQPCDPLPADGSPCYRGDNIFNNIMPGTCAEYQYDIASVHSPGSYW